jgi:glycosyltransferase involved in cell wall biosynthesis
VSLKVGFITPYFYPYVGGVQKCVLRIAQNLTASGHQVSVIASDFVPDWSNFNLSNEQFRLKRLKCVGRVAEVPLVPSIRGEIRNLDVDVLHINGMYPLFTDIALWEARRSGIPVLLNYHFDPVSTAPYYASFSKVYPQLASLVIKKANAIVATSSSYVKSSSILSAVANRVQIIPNAVEEKFFKIPNETKLFNLRSSLGISEKEKVVLFVGQLKRFKGINVLVTAYKIVSSLGFASKLVIVGRGPEENYLRNLVSQLGLSEKVIFAGYVTDADLPLYYHMCDVYVLPSVQRIENFGITLLEAMAAGKPVIASNLPGPNEVVEDKVTGFLFNPHDSASLACLLTKLLADSKKSSIMGGLGNLKAANYSWTRISSRFLELYERICAS